MPRSSKPHVALFLAGFLATGTLPAETQWHRLRSPNFEAITDGGIGAASNRLQRLEHLRDNLGRHFLASRATPRPTRVLFLGGGTGFARLRPLDTNGPAQVDGLYTHTPYENQIAVNIDADDRLAGQITQHEMAHLLCRDDQRRWPLWLSEGVACCLETVRPVEDRIEFGVPPIQFLETLRQKMLFDWAPLLSMDRRELYSLPRTSADMVYPQSWILCHYLLFGLKPAEAARFPRLLALIEKGTNSPAAFGSAFGWNMKDLDARVRRHADNPHLPVRFSPSSNATPAHIVVESAEEGEGDAWIALWQVAVGRTEDARREAGRLGQLPGYYPNLAAGFLAFESGDRDRATEHFRKAVLARPDAPLAQAYLARSLVESELELGLVPPDAKLDEARTALRQAVGLNPALQPAYATLGIVENHSGRPDAAVEALSKAIELDPRDFGSRLLAGSVLERQGRREAAAVELRVVAENSRRLELVREAKERLLQLERNGRWPGNPPSQSAVPTDRPIR